jgi:hypothetical protein
MTITTRVLGTGLILGALFGGVAEAQEPSEKAVRSFIDYAWGLTPERFTKPDGTVIQIDKNKRDEVMVPLETAREVVRVGRMSAHAQICDIKEEQVANYASLMKREQHKKTWTPQQMIFINQLHLTTVMLLTGKVKLVEKQDGKEVTVQEAPAPTQSCSDEQRQKVKDAILAYIKTGPAFPTEPTAAAAEAAAASAPAAKK